MRVETTDSAPRCGVCGKPIPPRSIRPGAPRCPAHRSNIAFVVYRGNSKRATPEERARLQARDDAARAAALANPTPASPPGTTDHTSVPWSSGKLAFGPRLRGGAVKGTPKLLASSLVFNHKKRAAQKAAEKAAAAERTAQRLARKALVETEGTDRQREAHRLVRVEGLSLADAGDRMGISKQTVDRLLKKFDKKSPA